MATSDTKWTNYYGNFRLRFEWDLSGWRLYSENTVGKYRNVWRLFVSVNGTSHGDYDNPGWPPGDYIGSSPKAGYNGTLIARGDVPSSGTFNLSIDAYIGDAYTLACELDASWTVTPPLWNDVNVLNPGGTQDYKSGYFDLYTSENNRWRYNLTNEDDDMTHSYGTWFQVKNIRPYYDYYELDRVEGYDSIPSSGVYQKIFNGANEVLSIYMRYKTYTVSYNANGGSSTPGAQSQKYNSNITLASAIKRNNSDTTGTITITYNANGGSNAPSKSTGTYTNTTPYTFNKWALGSTSGTQYSAGATYTVKGNATMYAVWQAGTTTRKSNPSITLSSSTPTRTGYDFLGWSTSSTATTASYSAGKAYTFSANTTLYAVWKAKVPYNLSIDFKSNTTTSITVDLIATGVGITNYTVYYKKSSDASYSSKSLGTATSGTITGLSVDTDYSIYFSATNSSGTGNSSGKTYSTLLVNPSITTPAASEIGPFSFKITATGSITPSRTLTYRFSKDNGSTWTNYQSSNSYTWTGLTEETDYKVKVQVKAKKVGTNASDTTATSSVVTIKTAADQARLGLKKDGVWKYGKGYYKINGQWKKCKKVYEKINGVWKINSNNWK